MKSRYHTKQNKELLGYLQSVPGRHITIADICEYLKSCGSEIGQTTVYRQMERLVDEGIVNKYTVDGSSAACFEYINAEENCCRPVCYHCKCEKCGKLIHMECEALAELQTHMMEHHGFRIDPLRTVFYGLCEACRTAEAVL